MTGRDLTRADLNDDELGAVVTLTGRINSDLILFDSDGPPLMLLTNISIKLIYLRVDCVDL